MKLIAIMPVRNEEWILRENLKTLSQSCDAIFVADQDSTDCTPEICKEFEKVHYLQYGTSTMGSENRRQILLDAARSYDGCNVILAVDADEIATATILDDPNWPLMLNSLQPRESVMLEWLMLWKHPRRYRKDSSVWANRWVHFLFRDDRVTDYAIGNWHEPRVPQAFAENARRFEPVKILHYQFVAWERMLSKQAYCRMIELLRSSNAQPVTINQKYVVTKDERNMQVQEVAQEWLDPWLHIGADLNHFQNIEFCWYDSEILRLFTIHGEKHFADLDIWDVNWEHKRELAVLRGLDGIPHEKIKDPRNIEQKIYQAYLNHYIATPRWRYGFHPREAILKLFRKVGLKRKHLERLGLLRPK